MGILEKESLIQTRNTKIKSAILKSIGAVGFLSVAVFAPNALKVFYKITGKKFSIYDNSNVKKSLNRLLKENLVKFELKNGKKFLRLTNEGKRKLLILEASNFKLKKPKKWDKKWRILIFDIKEIKRALRNKIRNTLIKIGFCKLQHSVWVYPYDCEDLITLLKADFKVGKDVLYIIADTIENDRHLKDFFGLN